MSNRWSALPNSEQEVAHMASTTTTTTTTPDPAIMFKQRVGEFIREEYAGNGKTICFYSHLDTDEHLPFLCEWGCCASGCCTHEQRHIEYGYPASFSWALLLLAFVLITILFSIIALLCVYWVNRRKTHQMRRQLAGSQPTDSSNVSQVSAPGSYYYPDGIHAFSTPKESMPY